jgi:hypothetical protein
MGDGGSLPVGMMVAALTMSVVRSNYLGPSGVVVGALMVGLVILDTTLVTYSRKRGGRPVFSGGRDHLTHRIVHRLGSAQAVALTLAGTQLVVCAITIAVAQAGVGWVLLAGACCAMFGLALIWRFERSWATAANLAAHEAQVITASAAPHVPVRAPAPAPSLTEKAVA